MEVKSGLVGNGAMRVTIPKVLRDELNWVPGDVLSLVRKNDKLVVSKKE